MIFHNAGKYNGDENSLPQREHPPGAQQFRECANMKMLSLVANIGCIVMLILLIIPLFTLGKDQMTDHLIGMAIACILPLFTLLPHEYLHALCYKKDVYMYDDLRHGLLFVVGLEDMSKKRYIFMCMLPNVIFGFIPYVLFLIFTNLPYIGLFGAICISMGFGDYINVINALIQMPKGSVVYLSGIHSYWYMPKE